MKKGFTLIELINVIIILGVILVIAVPKIYKVITSSKIDTYLSSVEMVKKSTEGYLSVNKNKVPQEIGETKEINLKDLIELGISKKVTSPFNKSECSGYVLITKIEENIYDYTPHIDCLNNIENSIDDKLVLNYKFNDFQEPTENNYMNPDNILTSKWSSYGFGDTLAHTKIMESNTIFEKSNTLKILRIEPQLYMTAASSYMQTPRITFSPGEKINASVYVKGVTQGIIGKSLHIHIYGTKVSGGNFSLGNISTNNIASEWQRHDFTFTNNDITDWTVVNLYFRANVGTSVLSGEYFYISSPQIEKKPYPTPFVNETRTGIIKDYSKNNNTATLNLNTTPRWIFDSERNSGVYEFNGTNTYIDTNYGLNENLNNNTISMWVKPNNISVNSMFLSSGQEFGYNERAYFGIYNNKWDMGISTSGWGSGTEIANTNWNLITITFNGSVAKMYANDKLVKTTNYSFYTLKRNLHIGKHDTTYYFNGLVDDFKVYNRILSEEEINLLYLSKKKE